MKATLYNLTGVPVMLDGQILTTGPQLSGCADPLPAPVVDSYFLVPACLAPAADARSDIVWSASIPHCGHCAPIPSKRGWFARRGHPHANQTLLVVEHYTPEDGRQGVGAEFFRQRYLSDGTTSPGISRTVT